jgi:hypothetical protein
LVLFLSSCFFSFSPTDGSEEEKVDYIYLTTDSSVILADFDGLQLEELKSKEATPNGAPVIFSDSVVAPDASGYTVFSTNLEDSTRVETRYSVKKIIVYSDEIVPVGDSTISAFGTEIYFENGISDAYPSFDGVYVASEKEIFRINSEGEKKFETEISTPIRTFILDGLGNYYIGTDEGLIIKLAVAETEESTEIRIGRINKIVKTSEMIYVLTDDALYFIEPANFEIESSCVVNISDFQVIDDKLFYVSNFMSTYGVLDLFSCSKIAEKNIPNPIGIDVRGE